MNKNYVKVCPKCRIEKSLDKFDKNRCLSKGVQPYCKDCRRIFARDYYKKNKIYIDKRGAKYRVKTKLDLFQKLGKQCKICGDDNLWHLQVDHINNDGYLDRKLHKQAGMSSVMMNGYLKIPINELRKKLQILCANCNHEKQLQGTKHYSELMKEVVATV